MSQRVVDQVKKQFPGAVLESHAQHGDDTIVVDPDKWAEIARFLKESPKTSMEMLTDLTAVDYPEREPRFEVVAHLYSLSKGHRLRMKARVGDADGNHVEIPSVEPLWASANWMERECYDLFGVVFKGHPDLRRILMYPEFEGHPLRKDYPANRTQPLIEYRDAPNIEKLPPFGNDEGMSFGRQTHQFMNDEE
ncbi:MAG: NADH-quinone oxidoreductase subunit C [Gemmatimonadetes bacterium]|nr:NADH-quinone oxidoreductase subunit C [Myxococcales bacterium]MCA9737144.1 NADH-quinone oxidoreductase subunit C [Gemmatimonadota bacterium]